MSRGMIPVLEDMSFLPTSGLSGDVTADPPPAEGPLHRLPTVPRDLDGPPIGDPLPRDPGDLVLLTRLYEVWPKCPPQHVMDWRVQP